MVNRKANMYKDIERYKNLKNELKIVSAIISNRYNTLEMGLEDVRPAFFTEREKEELELVAWHCQNLAQLLEDYKSILKTPWWTS
jgi:hypothetical protein